MWWETKAQSQKMGVLKGCADQGIQKQMPTSCAETTTAAKAEDG